MREIIKKHSVTVLSQFKPRPSRHHKQVFSDALYHYFATPEAEAKLKKYLGALASLMQIPQDELIHQFIRHLLARLASHQKITAADVDAAIKSELELGDTWFEKTVTHQRPAKAFDSSAYVVNKVLLGYGTYAMDDTVTLGGRVTKAVSYSGGIEPTTDLSKVDGYQNKFFMANVNLMYAYMGITALSFLLVPARLYYKWHKDGWHDKKDAEGKIISTGLKTELLSRDNIFEMSVNTIIVTFTAAAIFAPVISWPFVTVMFSFGLIAAFYTAYYTREAQLENAAALKANTDAMQDAIATLSQLRQELQHALQQKEPNIANIDRINALATSEKSQLQDILAARQTLLIKEQNNNSFFGKYGTLLKIGISTTTLIAHVVIATVFTASLTAAFWPGLIVMVALATAALAYIAYRQYRAYQLEQELHQAKTLQVEIPCVPVTINDTPRSVVAPAAANTTKSNFLSGVRSLFHKTPKTESPTVSYRLV